MYVSQETVDMEPFFYYYFCNGFGCLIWSTDGKTKFCESISYDKNIFFPRF